MSCTIPREEIEKTIAFHGHNCPGLAIGIRASELALTTFGHNRDSDLVVVVETDMCGVDAIQFLTGCTLGKGNLLLRDYGKMAFSFFTRKDNRGLRALLNPAVRGDMDDTLAPIMERISLGTASEEDLRKSEEIRKELQEKFMKADLKEMFHTARLDQNPPRPARILETLVCENCKENVMESRIRRFGGKTLCIPCFQSVEQKI